MSIKKLFASSLLIMLPLAINAETVQKWVDEKGQVHFSDQPPKSTQVHSSTIKVEKNLPPGGKEAINKQKRISEPDSEDYIGIGTDPDADRKNKVNRR